jgi:hypothetical protein
MATVFLDFCSYSRKYWNEPLEGADEEAGEGDTRDVSPPPLAGAAGEAGWVSDGRGTSWMTGSAFLVDTAAFGRSDADVAASVGVPVVAAAAP